MSLDFSGITLPFTVSDLMDGVMGLFGIVAAFVILGIAISFAPRFVSFVRSSVTGRGRNS